MNMKFYCYSSYRFSPVGFAMGYIDYPNSDKEYSQLKPFKDEFITRCFEKRVIKEMWGMESKTNHFFFVAKKLTCDFINNDNMPSKKYCNFIFEFSDVAEYRSFVNHYNRDSLEKAMDEFVVPDSFAGKYALKIDIQAFKNYLQPLLSDKNAPQVPDENELVFTTLSDEPDTDKELTTIAGKRVYKEKAQTYSTKKKFCLKRRTLIPIVLLIVAVTIAALVIISKNSPKSVSNGGLIENENTNQPHNFIN